MFIFTKRKIVMVYIIIDLGLFPRITKVMCERVNEAVYFDGK